MQKHKKRKTCKKSNKIKKITFAPAISTSYLYYFSLPKNKGGERGGSKLFPKLYRGQGLSKPTPPYDQNKYEVLIAGVKVFFFILLLFLQVFSFCVFVFLHFFIFLLFFSFCLLIAGAGECYF